MDTAPKRLLPSRTNSCIWCGKRFLPRGVEADRSVDFGPVQRSVEHIIPENIFGAIVTEDLCKGCNDRFGSEIDCHLLCDQRVVTAAMEAGVEANELLKRYRGIQRSSDGAEYEVMCQNGRYHIVPKLKDLKTLSIGSVDGNVSAAHACYLKQRLRQKVQQKFGLHVLPPDLEFRIKQLVDSAVSAPDQVHYDSVLDEPIRPDCLLPLITVQKESDPWITDWCIAKILFEFTAVLMPDPFLGYLMPVLERLRSFVEDGRARAYDGTGRTILSSGNEDARRGFHHALTICATRTSFDAQIRLFGSAWWRWSCNMTPIAPPPHAGFCIEIMNPFGVKNAETSVQVTAL